MQTLSLSRISGALALLMAALLASGCGGCDQTQSNNTNKDQGVTTQDMPKDMPKAEDMPPQICEPGSFQACRRENTPSIDICNAQGTGLEPSSCPEGQVCREAQCVQVACIPNQRRCGAGPDGALIPQICDAAGEGYEDLEACPEGSRCEEGTCLNRCQLAELSRSYIGCEYWAIELENHLLYSETDSPIPADKQPPFAVVLANTSTSYDAKITVYEDADTIAQLVPSRVVGSDIMMPGQELVTVYSEIVNAQGQSVRRLSGEAKELVLPKGAIMTLIMPHKRLPFGQTSLTKAAYRVVSDEPVVAYQFNPLCCNYNYTNDASLLLPKGALTENYMYLGYAVWAGSTSRLEKPYSATLTVMATEADTAVTIQLRKPKGENKAYSELIYPKSDARIEGPDDQGLMKITLQPHEALNLGGTGKSPVQDLTGALVKADKPIAVFGGHTCAFVPFNRGACDHMESQLFPMETWGQRFFLSPLKLRNTENLAASREGTYWKFVARQDDTIISVGKDLSVGSGSVLGPADEGVPSCESFAQDPATGRFTLDAGQTCEFGTRDLLIAQSSKPIMIGAFLSGQQSVKQDAQFGDHAGDPAFFLVPPEEQYRTTYSFLTPTTYFQSYVTVTTQPGFSVMLDGQPIDLKAHDYEELLDQGVIRAHIPVTPGPHSMEAIVPFGIVVYGYDDYVSYAYTGGLNLTKLSEF